MRSPKFWTEEKTALLREKYTSEDINNLRILLGARSISCVRVKASSLGLTMKNNYKYWSKGEEKYLEDNYETLRNSELSKHLGRNPRKITNKLIEMNLIRDKKIISKFRSETAKKLKGHKHTQEFKDNLKEIHTGKILSKKHKDKISDSCLGINMGEKNGMWNNGTSFLPYDKKFNNKFKRAIRKRDNYICLKCGKHQEKENRALSIHHIDYDKQLTIPQNCCAVCNKCNVEVNSNRKQWAKFFQSLLSEKYGYQYSDDKKIILDVCNVNSYKIKEAFI